ncbi:hypothetical protein [Fibrobacter sp.]|uniref:hypothetical protein n=1 Tax=Fibrobacter sp. TaxID=35828 RepID=UPI003890D674
MICKTITYKDYNGNERTEKFYFNLTEAELSQMQYSVKGGLGEYVQRIAEAQDETTLISIFKDLILKSYGEKSLDGRRFIKENGRLAAEFAETEAFSNLFMSLARNTDEAIEFFNGIVPVIKEEAPANVTALPTNN